MAPGMYVTKDGEHVLVSNTVDGHYMLTDADGRHVFV